MTRPPGVGAGGGGFKRAVWAALPEPARRGIFRRRLRTRSGDALHSRRMFAYDRRLLVNAYMAEIEAGVHDLEGAFVRSGMSVGYPSWNLLYFALLCSLPDREPIVIETGTNLGFSTIAMAQALADAGRGGTVRTVDIDPDAVHSARANVERAGLAGRVEFHVGDSGAFLRELAVDRIDFAFLDASHVFADVLAEFELIRPRVHAASGKVYFDNTSSGGVADALQEIRRRYGGNVVTFENCSWWPPGNAIWQP